MGVEVHHNVRAAAARVEVPVHGGAVGRLAAAGRTDDQLAVGNRRLHEGGPGRQREEGRRSGRWRWGGAALRRCSTLWAPSTEEGASMRRRGRGRGCGEALRTEVVTSGAVRCFGK